MGSITDVSGIKVGQTQDLVALTGCTIILCPQGAVGGVDVRGSAPGTRETDLLDPSNLVQAVHAIALCGGSAFGLAAATGVMAWLSEHGYGFKTLHGVVPIVPAAVIYDKGLGSAEHYPDEQMGYIACTLAGNEVLEGSHGVGTGASIGKLMGVQHSMKSGVGSASSSIWLKQPDGEKRVYTVGALVVTNSFGDVYSQNKIIGGLCDHKNGELLDTMRQLRLETSFSLKPEPGVNTTLAVIATDAPLNKASARKLAQMAQDAISRAIRPAHTMFDGDTVFALSTAPESEKTLDPFGLSCLGAIATEALIEAIERSVLEAHPAGGLPSARKPNRGE
ncbi:P1 family peptidase [Candidatus Chlorohelix sp.]|uniref:P1 family peptidase n=1 Tax=Candidatus Chlorohelix sp. TaxID=3139201 RepID=UPI00302DE272